MGVAFLDGQKKSGGIKLNDVIEDYKYVAAGKEIKVGDFVNYINGIAGKVDYGESVDTQLSTASYSGYIISAVQLDENRVFVAHSYGDSINNYYLYGMIVTINGATITCGTDTQLSTNEYTGRDISVQLLPNGNVFIAHGYSSAYRLYAMIVAIDGDTITAGPDTGLVTNTSHGGMCISTVLLDENRVFIAHCYNSSNKYLYGMVVTIDGTTITKGTDTALNSSIKSTGNSISACLLPNGNVFIAHSYNTTLQLYGIVVTIDGTTITKGTDTAITQISEAGRTISTKLLPNGNVFIAHSNNSSDQLYGIVCTISGTTITYGTDTVIDSTQRTAETLDTVLLDNGQVLILYNYASSNELHGILTTISGTTITLGTATLLGETQDSTYGEGMSALLLANGLIFMAHAYAPTGTSTPLYARLFGIDYENNIPTNNIVITKYEQQVTPAEETPFDAIALSDGIGGTETAHNEQVLIARPNVEVV
jgi:hypothetical protein